MKTPKHWVSFTSARPKNRTILLFVYLLLCMLSADQGLAQTVCTPSIKTDRGVYPEPPPVTLPPAGGTFCDPTFGTRIMRVTDETPVSSVPAGARTSYSFWPTFNSNNTKILVVDPGKDVPHKGAIYEFNPTTFTLGARLPDLPHVPGSSIPMKLDDAVWSYNDPNKLFVHHDNGTNLYSGSS